MSKLLEIHKSSVAVLEEPIITQVYDVETPENLEYLIAAKGLEANKTSSRSDITRLSSGRVHIINLGETLNCASNSGQINHTKVACKTQNSGGKLLAQSNASDSPAETVSIDQTKGSETVENLPYVDLTKGVGKQSTESDTEHAVTGRPPPDLFRN